MAAFDSPFYSLFQKHPSIENQSLIHAAKKFNTPENREFFEHEFEDFAQKLSKELKARQACLS